MGKGILGKGKRKGREGKRGGREKGRRRERKGEFASLALGGIDAPVRPHIYNM